MNSFGLKTRVGTPFMTFGGTRNANLVKSLNLVKYQNFVYLLSRLQLIFSIDEIN